MYKAGFARSQEAYEEAYHTVFNRLDWLEERLADRRYLFGDKITGFGDTTDFAAIKKHYHIDCNPGNIHQIIAKGPDEEAWLLPHGREKLSENKK